MNDLLGLRGKINTEAYVPPKSRGARNLNSNQKYDVEKLQSIITELEAIRTYWKFRDNYVKDVFVTVQYTEVVPKSRRLQVLLSKNYSSNSNDTVVGAKFTESKPKKHIITHYLPLEYINSSIDKLKEAYNFIKNDIQTDVIDGEVVKKVSDNSFGIDYSSSKLSKSSLSSLLVDVANVESFFVDEEVNNTNETHIVSIYETEVDITTLLKSIGIQRNQFEIMDQFTVRLTQEANEILVETAPYLVGMAVKDMNEFESYSDDNPLDINPSLNLPAPTNEPTIGVIDTHFNESVYFSNWVSYHNEISKDINLSKEDFEHGTAVSSIIVDGPSFNPGLEDNCGRFKVRHFGVTRGERYSAFSLVKMIKKIVINNLDIKVWNLSIGSNNEINLNYISPIGSLLDELQSRYDVIFVVAGTNDKLETNRKYIGSPADSINSVVVNACAFENDKSAEYSRHGPVLSFFHKPDISYYGGTQKKRLRVCKPLGEDFVSGTSYAAPWISRKLSYLIDILRLPREVAKALLIDSAVPWSKGEADINLMGYGVVPITIEDVVYGKEDEIKFYIYDHVKDYKNYAYNIPIPIDKKNDKHPYFTKLSLAYFTKSSRNQGVDYANTELNIKFGRVDDKGTIKDFNYDRQYEQGGYTTEEDARNDHRKWDNTKVFKETLNKNKNGLKKYGSGNWGFSIVANDRLNNNNRDNLNYGIVFTLKERNGQNRINTFIRECRAQGWIVNNINIENQIELHNQANETIDFDV